MWKLFMADFNPARIARARAQSTAEGADSRLEVICEPQRLVAKMWAVESRLPYVLTEGKSVEEDTLEEILVDEERVVLIRKYDTEEGENVSYLGLNTFRYS